MGEWRAWDVIIVAALIASIAPQARAQATKQVEAKNVSTVTANKHSPDTAEDERKGCPGTQYPKLSCEAISAQSDLEQARQAAKQADQAVRQADLFRWEILISAATMVVAFAAAAFAARAASAGTKSYEAFVAAEDAHLVLDFSDGTIIQHYLPEYGDEEWRDHYMITAKITNVGRSTARIRNCYLDGNIIGASKTLRRDEEWSISKRIERESLDEFEFVINYTSPITDAGKLTMKAQLYTIGKLVWGGVNSNELSKRGA